MSENEILIAQMENNKPSKNRLPTKPTNKYVKGSSILFRK